ncbi:MAG: ABC transporter ATP-binding protein [Planctomycetota bacterium]|nr:ABC transporter ATP-binding protein [Planctomycetota bacterium]
MDIAVETVGLSKVYRSLRDNILALNEVSLTVKEGTIFGLIGPNGAGKTTLIKALVGLLHQSSGKAFIFGVDTLDWRSRVSVGYLPEEIKPFTNMSAYGFLRYIGVLGGLRGAELRRAVRKAAETAGCEEFIHKNVKTLSRGMNQRLGLAATFLKKPRLLFLDEPTSGVDPLARKKIRDLLLLLRNDGVTIFLNSHLLSEVEVICDRIAILNRGRLLREGTVKELTETGRGWRISTVHPIPPTLLPQLKQDFDFPIEAVDERMLVTGATNDEKRNLLLDALRKNGILLSEFRPHSVTLEDVLIETVEEGETKR